MARTLGRGPNVLQDSNPFTLVCKLIFAAFEEAEPIGGSKKAEKWAQNDPGRA